MSEKLWPLAMPLSGTPVSLESTLEVEFTTSQIRELARVMNVKLKGTAKTGFVSQIAEVSQARIDGMAQNSAVFLEGLSNDQIDFVCRTMTARDPRMPLPRQVAVQVWARQYGAESERRLFEMIDSLRRRALLFPSQNYSAYGFRDVFYQWLPLPKVTPVMQWNVRPSEQIPATPAVAPEKRAKKQIAPIDPTHFLENFDAFLSAVMANGVLLRTALPLHPQSNRVYWLTGWEHDANEAEQVLRSRPNWVPEPNTGITIQMRSAFDADALTRLENQTGFSPVQCEFFWAIACALQLISPPDPNSLLTQASLTRIEEWLALADSTKLTRAWIAWSEQIMAGLEVRTAMNEARRAFKVMRAIGARNLTPAQMAAEWGALRRYVIRALRGVPAKSWFSWPEFSNELFMFYPDCAWTFSNRSEWWFAPDTGKGRLEMIKVDEWLNTVGQIMSHVLRDSLYWFGALDVQLGKDNRLEQFRITEVGQWLLSNQDNPLPEAAQSDKHAAPPITWSNTLTLLVPPAPERIELITLMRKIAERSTEPFSYRFTPDSIEAALSQGITLEQVIVQFEAAKLKLSPALIKQFNQAAKRHGRVRVYEKLTVVEFSDDFALRELSANTSLVQHMVYQISPRVIVIRDSAVDELMEEMEAQSYTPGIDEGSPQDAKL